MLKLLHAGQALARLHPLGLTDDWADKLAGESFTSPNQRVTHEHYSQVRALLRHLHAGKQLLHRHCASRLQWQTWCRRRCTATCSAEKARLHLLPRKRREHVFTLASGGDDDD